MAHELSYQEIEEDMALSKKLKSEMRELEEEVAKSSSSGGWGERGRGGATQSSSRRCHRSFRTASPMSFLVVVTPYVLLVSFPSLAFQEILRIGPTYVRNATRRRATSLRFGWCDYRLA